MLEIFQYDFMVRAFIAGLAIAIIAPLIGTFLVVRRYSLMADTLAHVSLLGVSFGLLLRINPIVTALGISVLASAAIEKLRRERKIFGESVLALFLTGSLAIATVLISISKGFNGSLFSYLFGSIATVSQIDLYLILSLGLVVLLTVYLLYKELFAISFDEELAGVNGLPVKVLNLALVALAAITVSLSMRIVGVLLISALMVIPVLAAMQYKRNFKQTLWLAVLFSLLSVLVGLVSSYYLDLASGGTIVIIALIIFFLSLNLNQESK
jgi:zinc transport system permease protein